MSTISSITLLDKFNVKDVGGLEEKVVNLGVNEVYKPLYHLLMLLVLHTYLWYVYNIFNLICCYW